MERKWRQVDKIKMKIDKDQLIYHHLLFVHCRHISTRPNGHMRVCCTANASAVQDKDSTNKTVSEAGVLRRDDGKPANLATTSLLDAWNNEYMKSVRRMMLKGKT